MLLTATGSAQTTVMLIWIVALFAIMYFMMWRPQKKEQKRVAAMLSAMEVGDVVVTTSGFYGVLIDITDDDVIVEFGSNRNCRIPMKKSVHPGSGKTRLRQRCQKGRETTSAPFLQTVKARAKEET